MRRPLAEVRTLRRCYDSPESFYVLHDRVALPRDMEGRTDFIRHSERDWLFFANLVEAWRILRKERHAVILSTGAGPAAPFARVGKLLGIPLEDETVEHAPADHGSGEGVSMFATAGPGPFCARRDTGSVPP